MKSRELAKNFRELKIKAFDLREDYEVLRKSIYNVEFKKFNSKLDDLNQAVKVISNSSIQQSLNQNAKYLELNNMILSLDLTINSTLNLIDRAVSQLDRTTEQVVSLKSQQKSISTVVAIIFIISVVQCVIALIGGPNALL